jgi:V8-like Glu-specific endopeptidase
MKFSFPLFFISLHLLADSSLSASAAAAGEPTDEETNKSKGPIQIGDHHPIIISSDPESSDVKPLSSEDGNKKTDTYTLEYDDASFLTVHFKSFHLPSGCVMDISDGNDSQVSTLTDDGKFNLGENFWAHHVNGNKIQLDLICDDNASKEQASFEIDDYVAGYPNESLEERRHLRSHNAKNGSSFVDMMRVNQERELSICGSDDKRNAFCYKTSQPTVYGKAKAVARLYINGSGACTGWLASGSNVLITNEHCIDSLSDVQNTDFEFMAEENVCSTTRDGGWMSSRNFGEIYDGTALLAVSAQWDYAVVQLAGNPASKHGFLELDNRKASINEQIYIPQHPGGRPKEIGVFDSNHNGYCKVKGFRQGCAPNDMQYTCDTEGGSSGSPVLSRTNNKVVALHHCGGGCGGNLGAPIYEFYDAISGFLSSTPPAGNQLHGDVVNPTYKLGLCEGDCDSDANCDSGLVCFQRNGYTAVPGCTGIGRKDWDYCVEDKKDLRGIAANPGHKLGLCEGDCDSDANCSGNLKCFQRSGYTAVPGCNGSGRKDFDYCIEDTNNNVLHGNAVNPTYQLGLCEGDCDSDANCSGNLKCFQRNGLTPVPGCTGIGRTDWDYCVDPSNDVLHGDVVNPTYKLGLCEGDCDSDANCSSGLVCFQRNGYTAVPGCTGIGRKDWDYCVEDKKDLRGIAASPGHKLGLCEGDCDSDANCSGNLKCFQRSGYTTVPGCNGSGRRDFDYCINP